MVKPGTSLLSSGDVTAYRTAFEILNDRLNTIQADLDNVAAIDTWSANAMIGDLKDTRATIVEMLATIEAKSIRNPAEEDRS